VRDLFAFAALSGIVCAPLIVTLALLSPSSEAVADGLMASFGLIAQAAITYRIAQALQGRRASVRESLAAMVMQPLPVLMLSLLLGVVTFVSAVLPQSVSSMSSIALAVIEITYCVAIPVAMIEHTDVMKVLVRSQQLTKGYRLLIFGVFVIIAMIGFLSSALLLAISNVQYEAVWSILSLIIVITLIPLYAVMNLAIYQELRLVREGVDIAEMSRFPQMRARIVPAVHETDAQDASRIDETDAQDTRR
jgi:hypothetical protein